MSSPSRHISIVVLGFRVQGVRLQVSGFGFRVTVYCINVPSLSPPVPRWRPMRVPASVRFRIRVSGFQGFRVSGFQGFRVSEFQGFRVSEFQGFRV